MAGTEKRKEKAMAKSKDEQTYSATVQEQCPTSATFLDPLIFYFTLPLNEIGYNLRYFYTKDTLSKSLSMVVST